MGAAPLAAHLRATRPKVFNDASGFAMTTMGAAEMRGTTMNLVWKPTSSPPPQKREGEGTIVTFQKAEKQSTRPKPIPS